jgi:hypothetical protein
MHPSGRAICLLFALCDDAHDEIVETCNMLFPRRFAMKKPSMEWLFASSPSSHGISRELAANQRSAKVRASSLRSWRDLTDGWPTRRSGALAR